MKRTDARCGAKEDRASPGGEGHVAAGRAALQTAREPVDLGLHPGRASAGGHHCLVER